MESNDSSDRWSSARKLLIDLGPAEAGIMPVSDQVVPGCWFALEQME